MNRKIVQLLIFLVVAASSCTASKESYSLRAEKRKAEKLELKMVLSKAIESRRYVVRMDKLIPPNGLMIELVPTYNFIIINGERISVSLGYEGRSFGTRRITGINFNGRIGSYKMKSDGSKGIYNVQIEALAPNMDKFNIYLILGDDGYCSATINNPNIQTVSYRGLVEPLSSGNTSSYSGRKPLMQ